jgi:hypothetical protein
LSDKKDILIACLYRFGNTLTKEICEKTNNFSINGDIKSTIKNILQIFINHNNWTKLLHDEIMALRYIDKDVNEYFKYIQKAMMSALTDQLKAAGYTFQHEHEQTYLLFQMIMGIETDASVL